MVTTKITESEFLMKFHLKKLPVCPYCGMPIDVVTVREMIKETGEIITLVEYDIVPD